MGRFSCFHNFSLYLTFNGSVSMFPGEFFLIYPVGTLLSFMDLYNIFTKCRKILIIVPSNIFSASFSVSSFSEILVTFLLTHWPSATGLWDSVHSRLLFLCFSDLLISMELPSVSLSVSSMVSAPLLNPSSEFFISMVTPHGVLVLTFSIPPFTFSVPSWRPSSFFEHKAVLVHLATQHI